MKRRRLMGKLFAYIVYSITNVNKKYGNSSFVNPLSISGDDTVTYTSNNTAVATIDNNGNVTIVAPGEAIITATVEDTLDFEYENNSASYTLIVTKADGNVSEPPTPKTIVYDGDDHQLINAGIGTGTMLYKFDYDEVWDEIIPIASESGTYTILYKSSENQYYTESSIGTVDVTIQKALSQYIAPTPVSPLVYNTNAQNLLNEGSTNDGLIWYSTDEINWSTNVPQGINAGDYRTYWELKGDYNHTDISSTLIPVKMDKVTPTVTPPCEGVVIPYDGETHELIQCGSTDYGTLKYSLDGVTYSTSIPTASAMDDYIIYWMVEGDSNVNDIEPATVKTSISGIIVLNPTINLEYNLIDYDRTAKQPSVEVLDDDGNIIPSSEYTVTYSNNVDAGTATVTITDVTGGTYTINGTKTFTINSIDPTYTAPTAKTGLVYNGDSQLLLNSGSVTSGGTMYYSSDGITWSENNNHSETNAGTYDTYWKIIGDKNYNDIGPTLILVTIDKAPVCLYAAPTYTSPTYNCNALNLLNAGSVGCGTMLYSSDNSTWSTTIPQGTNVGTYTSYWKIVGDNNHYGVNSTSIQTTISKCTPTIVTPTAKTLTYNGSAQVLANPGSVTSPSCTNGMEYSLDNSTWSSSVPSATNGGTYTVYYRVQGNSNINEVSGNVACSINEKPVTATVTVSPTSYNYDGTAKLPIVTVKDGDTTIPSSEYTVTYSNNVNAGTATVTISDKTGGNWNVIGSTTFTINKVSPTYTAPTAKSLTYNGNALALLNAGSTSHGTIQYSSDNSTWSTTIPSLTNANTYTTYWRLVGDNNHTNISSTSISTTIAKANLSAPTATGASVAYGNTATASASGGGGHDSIEWSNGNTLTGNAGSSKTTKARWNGNSNYNPSPWSNEVTLSIVKASGSITCATVKTGLVYNLSAQTLVNAASSGTGTVVYHSVLQEPDGTLWLHIAHHNNPAGGLFSSSDSFSSGVYKDANRWFNVHSSVSLLSTFEFLVRQKATTTSSEVKYRWRQNKSPLTATYEDVAPSAVTRITTSGYTDGGYGGLYILNSSSYMVIANTSKGNWFGAFGAWSAYNGGIPGYPNTTVTNGYMDLYVKVNSASINGGWSTVVPAEMDAATYTIACKALASTNYNESSVCTVNSTISRAKTSSASAANKTYNGTTESNGTAQSGVSGSYVSWSGTPSATNAGNYTAYANVLDSNYAWSDGTYAQKTISWTMSRRGQTAPVLNGASTTYHNTATASVKTAGTVSGGTATAPGTLTWSNLSRTALGSLTASAYYAATATNFSASSAGTATVTITCANDLSVSVTRTNRTWSGSSQVIASIASYHGCTPYLGTGSSSAVSSWANANTSISATNVGTYYIWKKGTKDGNHCNDVGSTYDGSVTISCNNDYVIVAPTANTLTYNGAALNLLSGGSARTRSGTNIPGSFSYGTGTWVGSNLTGNWTFTPSNSGYCTKTGSVSGAKINTRVIKVTGNSASYTYNGSGRSVSGGSITSGSLGTGDTITITASGASGTNAGSYTNSITSVVIKKGSTDVTNQYSITKANGYLSIGKAGQNPPTPAGSTVIYNETATASASGGGGQGSIEWSNGNSRTAVGYQDTQARWSGNTNYNASAWSNSVRILVNKHTPRVVLLATNRVYNGSALYSTATVAPGLNTPLASGAKTFKGTIYYGTSSGATTYSVAYNGSAVNLSSVSVTNVGSVTVYAYFAPNSTCNDVYNESAKNASKTMTISKANQNAPSVINSSGNYTTSGVLTASASGGGGHGTLYYRSDANGGTSYGSATTTAPTRSRSSVGTTSFIAYWGGDTNYNASGNSSKGTLYVYKANGTISVSGKTNLSYSGSAQGLTSYSGTGGTIHYRLGKSGSWTTTPPTATNIGSYTVYWYSDASTTHYGLYSSSSPSSVTATIIQTYVNLGLPSGRKWAKMNIGASSESGYGYYFSWGNTTQRTGANQEFTANGYMNTTAATITSTNLPVNSTYDAAYKHWGSSWRIPTKDEFVELTNNTNVSRVTVNGVKCVKFVNKSNSSLYILFPASGAYFAESAGNGVGSKVYLWTSDIVDENIAHEATYYADSNYNKPDDTWRRYAGLPIRPVLI